MTTLPLSTFWDTSKTEGEANSGWFQKILSVMKELPGGAEAVSEVTIATGSITPTTAAHTVDTEADASTDTLSVIDVTNVPEGRRLLLRAENTTRDVVLEHLSGSSGQLSLKSGADVTLDDTEKWIEFMLIGTTWYEINSNFQRISTPVSIANGGTGLTTGDNIIKAWINFNGTGTIVINDSYNVASITDLGVGNWRITFNTAFATANYSAVLGSGVVVDTAYVPFIREQTTTYIDIGLFDQVMNVIDGSILNVIIIGG